MRSYTVRIKSIGNLAACTGVHLCDGNNKLHRKLEVGEVVRVFEGGPGFDAVEELLDQPGSVIELTSAEPTRPVLFKDTRTAKWSTGQRMPAKEADLERSREARAAMKEQLRAELAKYEGEKQGASDPDQPEVKASDAARSLAKEAGIDIAAVKGTGKDGNVTIGDVKRAAEALQEEPTETV